MSRQLITIATLLACNAGTLVFAPLGHAATWDLPEPGATASTLRIQQVADKVVLTWFSREGVPWQVESSADMVQWGAVGPVIPGTNGWISVRVPMTEGRTPFPVAPGVGAVGAAASSTGSLSFFRIKDVAAAALDAEQEESNAESRVIQPAAVTAIFASTSGGVLTVTGDNLDNRIVISRNAAGQILVNGGAVAVSGGIPTVANTSSIQVFGQGGNDTITIDEANGALPRALLFGGSGNDTLTGGSAGDQLFGQAGNDTLVGRGGVDFLFGGTENDVLNGGDGNDQCFGESGDDRFIWNPGDDTDLNEGGSGNDTVEINGANVAESFTATANGTRVRFDCLQPMPFAIDIGTCENLVLKANGGNDTFAATGNLAALIKITVDGGTGNDHILGSNGVDVLIGGDGNDFIDGQQGNDVVMLGAGNDTFQWDPGDGSDVIEGQAGTDKLVFNGSAGNEIFDVSAQGGRVLFTRNLGNVVIDLDDVEQIEVRALAGADTITVNSLQGTDVSHANILLSGALGGTTPDSQADVIIVNGSAGNDTVTISGAGASYTVNGLRPVVTVSHSAGTNDTLVVNTLAGNDTINARDLPVGLTKLTLDGGAGNDNLGGSHGADVLLGGDGDDFLEGQMGDDIVLMGAGNDVYRWQPGEGSEILEGQGGTDTLQFFASGNSESFNLFANNGRVAFFSSLGNVILDLNDLEKVDLRALGGADNIVIGDLSGTDLTNVGIDLRGPNGGGDGHADLITVNGTQGADLITVAGDAAGVRVTGLSARIDITNQESVRDQLTINALGGDDVVNATALKATGIKLTLNGGLGNDVLRGGEGADQVNGGDGNDIAFLGLGNDSFTWNPGDDNDTVEGQGGVDTLVFNGANVAEGIDISANGGRVRFFRNVASVSMDLNDMETISFNALGGADSIVVNSLTGTDVTSVNLNLAGSGDAGDAQPDTVILNGTAARDTVVVTGSASSPVQVTGIGSRVSIARSEPTLDRVVINLLAGNDSLNASGLNANVIQLIADGGDGNDTLTGSAGPDILLGGAGNDVLTGGPGLDVLDGGSGNNVITQ